MDWGSRYHFRCTGFCCAMIRYMLRKAHIKELWPSWKGKFNWWLPKRWRIRNIRMHETIVDGDFEELSLRVQKSQDRWFYHKKWRWNITSNMDQPTVGGGIIALTVWHCQYIIILMKFIIAVPSQPQGAESIVWSGYLLCCQQFSIWIQCT